jgi:hypothetical protein
MTVASDRHDSWQQIAPPRRSSALLDRSKRSEDRPISSCSTCRSSLQVCPTAHQRKDFARPLLEFPRFS